MMEGWLRTQPGSKVLDLINNSIKKKLLQRSVTFTPTTVANQQIRLLLNESNFDYSKTMPDGSDLYFIDSESSLLSHWIESWQPNGSSVVWIKIPSSSTQSIVMGYANEDIQSTSDIDSVMDQALLVYYYGSGAVAAGAQAFQTLDFVTQDVGANIANYVWGTGTVSISGQGSRSDYVSLRWRGWVKPTVQGVYNFRFTTDDGQRLYIADSPSSLPITSPPQSWTLQSWIDQAPTQYTVNFTINDDKPRFIWNEWFETGGGATSQLGWVPPGGSSTYPITVTQLRAPKFSQSHGDPFDYSATVGDEL